MNRLFNMDNPFFQVMGRIADLFILNFVFMICCIPIVTIGPALSAMFYVTMKMVKNEESYIIRSFFHSFKQNLKQGIVIHLIMMVLGGILIADYYIINHMSGNFTQVMRVLIIAISVIYALEYLYIYPVLAKFYNSIKNTFRNSILMAIRHLPYTIIMLIVSAAPILLFLIKSASIQSFFLMALIIIGPAVIAYVNSMLFVRIFEQYVPKDEDEEVPAEAETAAGVQDILPPNVTPIFRDETPETSGETENGENS